jgi:hypothetical protein
MYLDSCDSGFLGFPYHIRSYALMQIESHEIGDAGVYRSQPSPIVECLSYRGNWWDKVGHDLRAGKLLQA